VLAVVASTAAQKGPLWWAANHRLHHRYTDTTGDPHSPRRGLWWSHVGWIVSPEFSDTRYEVIPDLVQFPELRWLNNHDWVGPWALGAASYLIAGWSGLVVAFFASTVLLWHATFAINSLAHLVGGRRYDTADTSRNSWALALITFGEGWHNNHHPCPTSARQGFQWWEIDITYLLLRGLRRIGLVHHLHQPNPAVLNHHPTRWQGDLAPAPSRPAATTREVERPLRNRAIRDLPVPRTPSEDRVGGQVRARLAGPPP
jgi:stearoyl-CoA desaturase (delta-9 desaturase)